MFSKGRIRAVKLTAVHVVIESPVLSRQGDQLAPLKVTVIISGLEVEGALQQAVDAAATMAPAPKDPIEQIPRSLSILATATAIQFNLRSILERLVSKDFMGLADVAAEVRVTHQPIAATHRYLSSRSTHLLNLRGELYSLHIK